VNHSYYSLQADIKVHIQNMGLTHVTAKASRLDKTGTPFEAEFLVDTGAIDCLAPEDALGKAGILSEGKKVYELANGTLVEMNYGFARIEFMGSETVVQISFGPKGSEPILGVVALENTGIVVDPTNKSLKRLSAIPLK